LVGWWWCTTGSGSLSQLCRRQLVFPFFRHWITTNKMRFLLFVFCAGLFFSLWDGTCPVGFVVFSINYSANATIEVHVRVYIQRRRRRRRTRPTGNHNQITTKSRRKKEEIKKREIFLILLLIVWMWAGLVRFLVSHGPHTHTHICPAGVFYLCQEVGRQVHEIKEEE
jgi:hypothetical protein